MPAVTPAQMAEAVRRLLVDELWIACGWPLCVVLLVTLQLAELPGG